MSHQLPPWLDAFSARFGLYGKPAVSTRLDMRQMSTAEFREKVVEVLRDLAEQEHRAHRSAFDMQAHTRSDALQRAADIVAALPEMDNAPNNP